MWWAVSAFGILGGIIFWELSTGIALDERWRGHRRAENPRKYWRLVAGHTASVLILLLIWSFVR